MPASDSDSQLLRFFSQSPSFLDDPQNVELFQKRARKAFGPREKDLGRPSYWEASAALERTRLEAHYGGQRDKLTRFNILNVKKSVVASNGFVITEERDNNALECVADLHRTIDMRPSDALDNFIELLREQLLRALASNHCSQDTCTVSYSALSKDDVKRALKVAVRSCPNLDLDDAPKWVRSEMEETSPAID